MNATETTTSSTSESARPVRKWDKLKFGYGIAMGSGIGLCALAALVLWSAAHRPHHEKQWATPGPGTPNDQLPIVAVQNVSPRTAGMNYVVIRSFADEQSAWATRDALASKNVSCTVEKNLPGWTKNGWYSVVGTTGFETVGKTRGYERYVKALVAMKYEPKPYKWKADGVATN